MEPQPELEGLVYLPPPPMPWTIEMSSFGLYYTPAYEDPEAPEEQTHVVATVIAQGSSPQGGIPLFQCPAIRLPFSLDYFQTAMLEDVRNLGRRRKPTRLLLAGPDQMPNGPVT